MNYELAKELKDAEYPQPYPLIGELVTHNGEQLYIPTLSELIAACGEGFDALHRMTYDVERNGQWQARAALIGISGTTPEIAVAKLWLALNKK